MAAFVFPFAVTEYVNPRTKSVSFRVTGSHPTAPGGRYRKNFPLREAAQAFCDLKNAEALRHSQGALPLRVVSTRLTEQEMQIVEAAKVRGRWSLAEIIEAGEATLKRSPTNQLVSPLLDTWLEQHEGELNDRWYHTIRKSVRIFQRGNERLRTHEFTKAHFVEWLNRLRKEDGSKIAGQTKANHRNAMRRVCTDLVNSGKLAENPCVGLRIARAVDRKLPTTLSATQAEALIRAFESDEQCRRILGWAVECLFVGLRPENEAPRAVWGEINLRSAEQHVLGYKRGVKPRFAPLLPAAVDWLKSVKKQLEAQTPKGQDLPAPGLYHRHLRERAVRLANEQLAETHPGESPIVWDEDILRHTHASMRAGMRVPMETLAQDMGTSVTMIHSHYRKPKPKGEAERFWAIRPKG